jgi:hypothetical protein
MRLATVTAALLVILASLSWAEEKPEQPRPPATKLEAFQARTGIVVIRGYTTVGSISGLGSTVTVDAREFRDASNPKSRETGVSILVKEHGRLERENRSFVDGDEIDSLLRGIDYITKLRDDVTRLEHFEADYRTKGDLRITVYNDTNGKIKAAISSGRIGQTQAFVELSGLEAFRRLVVAAKEKF